MSRRALCVTLGAFALMSFAIPATAQTKTEKAMLALFARPAEALIPLVTVRGDGLDPRIEINTKDVTKFVSKGWLASTTIESSFLRAYIDKKTGQVTAQVYHFATQAGDSAPSFYNATYETPTGIKEVSADRVGFDVSCARYGCTYYEDIVFPIDFDTLEAAAKLYDPAKSALGIKYRLFGRSGARLDDGVPVNEIAAFIAVVNKQRQSISQP